MKHTIELVDTAEFTGDASGVRAYAKVHFDVPKDEVLVLSGCTHTGGRITLGTHVELRKRDDGTHELAGEHDHHNHAASFNRHLEAFDPELARAIKGELEQKAIPRANADEVKRATRRAEKARLAAEEAARFEAEQKAAAEEQERVSTAIAAQEKAEAEAYERRKAETKEAARLDAAKKAEAEKALHQRIADLEAKVEALTAQKPAQ